MERERWERRYRSGEYDARTEPMAPLARAADWLPDGRALDVAAGVGRNAVFLAERGYDVDAVDISPTALRRGRERARERGVHVDWIRADVDQFAFPDGEYDVIAVGYYQNFDRLPAITEALAPGGVLVYRHHLRTDHPVDRGPSGDRYRMRSNDLLRACLDLTVLRYDESLRESDGDTSAVVSLVARNDDGPTGEYPPAGGPWPAQ